MSTKKKILVVEDNYELRASIIDILEENNYSPIPAADGKSALQIVHQLKPDLIICDIMMPGMDGYEILEKILEIFSDKEPVPFIFLTAKISNVDIRKGMNLGADDYLTKPFNIDDLLKTIEARLKRIQSFRKKPQQDNITKQTRLKENQGVMISDRYNTEFIQVNNIVYITAAGDYCKVFLKNGKKIISQKFLLKDWEDILPENLFYRTHRSYIVNINQIENITPWFKRSYKIKLKNIDDEVYISERYASKLKKIISI